MRYWLKELREELKVTQEQIAKQVSVSRQAYSLIENGSRRPSPKVAQKLGTLLGFEWTRFYEDDGA